MSSTSQIKPSHTGTTHLPVSSPTPPIAFPPAPVTSPTSSSLRLFYLELPAMFSKMATLALPVAGETPEQESTRQNTLYLAQLCALKGFFDPPAPLIPHPIEPGPVHPMPLVRAVVPEPEPGNPPIRPIVPADPVLGGEPFAALLQYVHTTGNLNGVASLFLTLWNVAGLRKDVTQTTKALEVWKVAVLATPASDLPEVIFYDHAVKQMFRLPASILGSLSENSAVSARWAKGETFRKELGTLATTTYTNPFSTPTPPVGGVMSPMFIRVSDWFQSNLAVLNAVGSCGVMIDSSRKACWFSGVCYVTIAGANVTTGTSTMSDFFNQSSQSRYAPITEATIPADTPTEIASGWIGYVPGPNPNVVGSYPPPVVSPGEPDAPANGPGPGPEAESSQSGEGSGVQPQYVRRQQPAEPKPMPD